MAMARVSDPADPRRCKRSFPHEQCWNRAEHGSEFCAAHGGRSTAEAENRRMYFLAEAQNRSRLAHFAEHDDIKSLREEIALTRMLIERRWNLIKNGSDSDLLQHSAPINNLLLTVERLVKSCHAIEQDLGNLLARDAVLRLGQLMCQIVIEELDGIEGYEEIIDRITERLVTTISGARNEQPQRLALAAP